MTGERPLLLFAPGAGAPSSSAWMGRWAARLSALGDVVRFDYSYMVAGRKSPDRPPALLAAHRAALAAAQGTARRTAVLVGKSMGSRIGCHVALAAPVSALVCLGYPLRGARGDLRSEVLLALRTPILFVQGSRDALCPLDALEQVRGRMTATSALHVVEQGNHSLEVGARALAARGRTQDEVEEEAFGAIRDFLRREGLVP